MFFTFMRNVISVLLFILNGNAHYSNREKVPKEENYILVSPHRTFFDPVYLAIGAKPKAFIFMAKEELFKIPVFGFLIKKCGAFPVNREKPGPSVLKYPVKKLKQEDVALIMFPSGTRHSTELKGGVAVIAKMAKVKIVPAVYQGPLSVSKLLKRKRVDIRFGDAIDIQDIPKLDEAGLAEVANRLQTAFDTLDYEINPDYRYIPSMKKKKVV